MRNGYIYFFSGEGILPLWEIYQKKKLSNRHPVDLIRWDGLGSGHFRPVRRDGFFTHPLSGQTCSCCPLDIGFLIADWLPCELK